MTTSSPTLLVTVCLAITICAAEKSSKAFENHVGFFSDLPKTQAIFLSDSQFRRRGRYVAGCWLFNYKVEIFEIVRPEYVF